MFYYDANFDEMVCIHASNSLAQIEALEASLIDFYMDNAPRNCRNRLLGGEGMRKKKVIPKTHLHILCMLWQPTLPKTSE